MAITLAPPPGQPLDTDLTAIAGLTSAADKGIQFTGAGTAGTFDLTTAGKALLDDADATAQRVTLGLVIGTNVQAFDADLADIAAIADVQGDIMVRGAAGWERLAKSATATDVLTAGATQPAWAAPTGGGSVATDTIWNAAGDLAVGTGPDAAARLGIGTALQTLRVNAGATALEWATPAGGITDGDKGDITVSGGGAAWAIDNDVVTNAKAANMATATIKGRTTAGTGDAEDLTAAQTRTLLALVPGTDVQAFSSVLAATTASFLTADETKLDGIEALADVTDAGNVNAAGAVMESDYNANTILAATADNTPLPITMGASTILARLASGDIIASTPSQMRTLLGLVIGTDVQAFSATLTTLASSTAAGLALMDDADATAQRATLGLGTIATQAASAVAITGGAISATALTLKAGTAPTAEGVIEWNTTNNTILVGDGAGTKTFGSDQLVAGVRSVIDASVAGFLGVDVVLSGGKAGGDTLMGGTGSGENLILQSTDHVNQGSVFLLGENVTYTATPVALFGVSSARTITSDYAAQRMPVGIHFAETRVMTTAGNSGTGPNVGFQWGVTYKNASGVAANLSSGTLASSTRAFLDISVQQADTASVQLGIHNSFASNPTFQGTGGGGFTSAAGISLSSGATIIDTQMNSITGFSFTAPVLSGTGSVVAIRAIDIPAITTATSINTGIRNAATSVMTPTASTAITAVSGTISHAAALVTITADASYTLTSAPTISDGVQGEELIVMNVDTADTITIQDEVASGLSTNLRLSAATVALGPRQSIRLIFNTTVGAWVQVNSVLTQQSAYTQTFATANKTHAARGASALTDNTAGTATTTLEALTSGTVYATDVAAIRNNFADLAAMVNLLRLDQVDTAELANSIVDDLQALRLVA